jgi:hypothetical protein
VRAQAGLVHEELGRVPAHTDGIARVGDVLRA